MAEENGISIQDLDPGIVEFLESCLQEKGIKEVPQALHDQMISDLADRLQDWLMQAVFGEIKEKDVPELEALIESQASQEEIMQFLQERVPNIQEVYGQAMANFKQTYLSA